MPPSPFTHVLCPVDFSDASAHAVEQAIALAGWYASRLTLLNVRPPSAALVPEMSAPGSVMPAADMEQAQEGMAAYLRVAKAAGIPTDVLIDVGDPVAAILSRVRGGAADVVVMGTHGAGGFSRLVLGSVTEKVLRRAPCPVLTVPPRPHATSALPFRRILCPVDFSAPAVDGAARAISLAEASGAAVTLLYVLEWPWDESPEPSFGELPAAQSQALDDYRRYSERSALARLRSLVPDASASRVEVIPRVTNGKAHTGILRVAAEEHADLIVVGVHGRRAADLMLLGSTTNQVVRAATCPVLTIRN